MLTKQIPQPTTTWKVVSCPDSVSSIWGVQVKAFSKSEARAALKRRLGLKRLPVGVVLEKI